MMEKVYGLIGYPLTHSFSKKYFAEKFEREGIDDTKYELFPLENLSDLPGLLSDTPGIKGLNVTIPYKEQVLPLLHDIDNAAARIGAVNTIKVKEDGLWGFNTDAYGFEKSLFQLQNINHQKALILGSGGASKAVIYALKKLNIEPTVVSRSKKANALSYEQLDREIIASHRMIVNTTPLGTFPDTESLPPIPYEAVGKEHLLYDLVYNPSLTAFLKKGKARGATTLNGLNMLKLQAEKAWEIWNNSNI